MFRNVLTAAFASAAFAAAPALAQPGGGHGGPPGGHPGGGPPMTHPGGGPTGSGLPDAAMQGRMNSMGPEYASPTGIAHANENSVLKGATTVSGPLTGLTTGMTVNFDGSAVGTVSRIVASNDGTIRRVLVTDMNGRTVSLSPNSLALEGGVLTTTRFRGH